MPDMRVLLPRDGAEYAHFIFSEPVPAGVTADAKFGAADWVPIDLSGPIPKVLLRGPLAAPGTGYTIPFDCTVKVRVNDTPEVVVRGAGQVALTG